MTDPNDSDGSWEFVDKDSDSETSSVASPYDTGLPDEVLARNLNEEELNSGWMNNEDFITDSDIEACAEETADSEQDETTLVQVAADQSQADDQASAEDDEKDEEKGPPPVEMTQSMLCYENDELIDTEEVNKMAEDVGVAEEQHVGVAPESLEKDDASSIESVRADDTIAQEVKNEETPAMALSDDVLEPSVVDTEQSGDVITSGNESADSDFERLDQQSLESLEIVSDTTSVESLGSVNVDTDAENPSLVEGAVIDDSESRSDTGSGEFTVISAPSNPPVEILCRETETSYMADPGIAVPSSSDDEDMSGDETQSANRNAVYVATDAMPTYQRTVGMVTDHFFAPPNNRLMISLIMISLGVGYMLGRYSLQHSPTLLQTMPEEPKIGEAPRDPIQFIYHGQKQPLWENEIMQTNFDDTLKAMKDKQEALKAQLVDERSRVKNQNRGLRKTILQLKEDNNNYLMENMKKTKDLESSSLAFNLLKQSCHKQERLHNVEMKFNNKEIQQLKARLLTMEKEALFLNQTMVLYKSLQEQHERLLALYNAASQNQREKDTQNAERQMFLMSLIGKCRRRIGNLHFKLRRSHFQNAVFRQSMRQYEPLPQDEDEADVHNSGLEQSPLMRALAEQARTCPMEAKHLTQARRLRSRVRVQRLRLQKMAEDSELMSRALETLYRHAGDLSNNVMCLQHQLHLVPQIRAPDAVAFCRSSISPAKGPQSDADPLLQCSLPVNGTLAFDLTTLNLTVKLNPDQFSDYKLQVYKQPFTHDMFFNATCLYKDFIAHKSRNPTPNPACQPSEHPVFLGGNVTMPPLSPLFLKAVQDAGAGQFHPHSPSRNEGEAVCRRGILSLHADTTSARARFQLVRYKADIRKWQQTCKAKERALNGSLKEAKTTKVALTIMKHELMTLQSQKKELNRQLVNVTQELLKKPSLQQCFIGVLDTDNLMKRINSTKTYKTARKMAQKVEQASNKAWRKFKKFVNKFGSNESQHEPHEWQNHEDVKTAHMGHRKRERSGKQPRKSRTQDHENRESQPEQAKFQQKNRENMKRSKNKAKMPSPNPQYHKVKGQHGRREKKIKIQEPNRDTSKLRSARKHDKKYEKIGPQNHDEQESTGRGNSQRRKERKESDQPLRKKDKERRRERENVREQQIEQRGMKGHKRNRLQSQRRMKEEKKHGKQQEKWDKKQQKEQQGMKGHKRNRLQSQKGMKEEEKKHGKQQEKWNKKQQNQQVKWSKKRHGEPQAEWSRKQHEQRHAKGSSKQHKSPKPEWSKNQHEHHKPEESHKKHGKQQAEWSKKEQEKQSDKGQSPKSKNQYFHRNQNEKRGDKKFGKRHSFREIVASVIDKHMKQAKRAGKKVFNQLVPFYDIWKNTYCEMEEKSFPESFNKIWCYTDESSTETHPTEKDPVNYMTDEGTSDMHWGLELYRNFTEFLAPMLPWRDNVEGDPSFGDHGDNDDITPAEENMYGTDWETTSAGSRVNEAGLNAAEEKDPLWFSKMFKARENLRKDWRDMAPLSTEEFDWFLKMFESRAQLRRSGTDSHPTGPVSNHDMDWFLKMFEARARIRFERDANDDDETPNWFLKMAEARNNARCHRSEVEDDNDEYDNEDWYHKMFHAREKLRDEDESADWYYDMVAARKKAREELASKAGKDVPADGWCQA